MAKTSSLISGFSNYALRSRFRPAVNVVREASKNALGAYFDLFVKEYKTGGLTFEIPTALTTRSLRGKFVVDTYELAERTLVARHLKPGARVLELGGSIGVVSCTVNARLADPKAHVVLEPNSDLIPWLTLNRDRNGCQFAIESKIVSHGERVFLDKSGGSDSGQVVPAGQGADGNAIETVTWDELERAHGIKFDTLVADIEGAEYGLFTNFAENIKMLSTIIIEMHPAILGPAKQDEIYRLLQGAGFQRAGSMLDTEAWTR